MSDDVPGIRVVVDDSERLTGTTWPPRPEWVRVTQPVLSYTTGSVLQVASWEDTDAICNSRFGCCAVVIPAAFWEPAASSVRIPLSDGTHSPDEVFPVVGWSEDGRPFAECEHGTMLPDADNWEEA